MTEPRRKFVVFANWKSTGTLDSVRDISRALAHTAWPPAAECEVVVAPSFLHAHALEEGLGRASRRVHLGAQDCYGGTGGAHTGETTAELLVDFGVTWVLVGHSERRHDPLTGGESDAVVGAKATRATAAGLRCVACVGETAAERAAGKATRVVTRQLAALAHEVWAIGSGMVASLEQIQEMHEALRGWVREHVSPAVAATIPILYGGSVSRDNCEPLAALPDVDGLLVGGAAVRLVYAGHAAGVKSEFAEIVCRAVDAHHAAFAGGGHVPCAPGVVQRGQKEEEKEKGAPLAREA